MESRAGSHQTFSHTKCLGLSLWWDRQGVLSWEGKHELGVGHRVEGMSQEDITRQRLEPHSKCARARPVLRQVLRGSEGEGFGNDWLSGKKKEEGGGRTK
jgi:hypothetical protein